QDGASALTAIGDGDIDLVVLDLGLPRMDGIDVIRKVRAAGGNVPILVLSARERASDRTLGLDVGADDYLGKPFDTPELLARV
ncbi:MAG: response regulator, partial [Stenotrophomonas sp.]